MGAFPGRAHSPGSPPPSSASFPLAPPATHQVPASQKTRHWKNGTESPALLEVKLHFLFGVNARAGRLTKSAAFFDVCPASGDCSVLDYTSRSPDDVMSCRQTRTQETMLAHFTAHREREREAHQTWLTSHSPNSFGIDPHVHPRPPLGQHGRRITKQRHRLLPTPRPAPLLQHRPARQAMPHVP